MDKIKATYQWSPALWNAVFALILMLVNQFIPNYSQAVKTIVDAVLVLLSGGATYTQVTPVAKLNK